MNSFMEAGSSWTDVLTGLMVIVVLVVFVKLMYSWYIFRKSVQKELYSNFIEYFLKRKSIKKLSKSAYFENEFGNHKIIYQLVKNKKQEKPLAFVLVVLSSGIYALNIKSEKGAIQAKERGDYKNVYTDKKTKKEVVQIIPSPANETKRFSNALLNKLDANIPVYEYVVYPDHTQITVDGKEVDCKQQETLSLSGMTGLINRKSLSEAIKDIHTKCEAQATGKKITDEQMNDIYHAMTAGVTV